MKYFLITVEFPVNDGIAKQTGLICTKNAFIGNKELNAECSKRLAVKAPHRTRTGDANILFCMELTQEQSELYNNN